MRACLAAVVFLLWGCSQLWAATLDFDVFPAGATKQKLQFSSAAVSSSNGGALYVYGSGDFGMPVGGGVCALGTGFTCDGDISLLFIGPVSNLTFKGYFASPADRATVAVYADDALVDFLLISGNPDGRIDLDLRRTPGITRVEIGSVSATGGKGIAYGDFDFDVAPPGTPPPPPLPPANLSLDAFPGGVNEASLDLGPAVLVETSGGKIFVYRTGDYGVPKNGAFCALVAGKCTGDFTLDFDTPITDLIFSGFFAKPGDSAIVSLFDGDLMIYTGRLFGNSTGTIRFDFREIEKLTRVRIEDSSGLQTGGIAYGNFGFNAYEAPVTPVPLPAPLLLMAAGLAALALPKFSARRRTRAR